MSNWSGLALRMGASFLLLPFIVQHVGPSGYGKYLVLVSVFGYSEILDFGFSAAIVRYVARFAALGEPARLNTVLGGIFRFYLLLASLIVGVAALAWAFPQPWFAPAGAGADFPLLIFIFGLATATSFFQIGWRWVLRGRDRYDVSNLIDIGALAVRVVLIVSLLRAGHGLLAVVIADFLECLVSLVGSWIAAHRLFPEIRPSWRRDRGNDDVREVRSYSVWVFFNQISQQLRFRTDSLVIGGALNAASIAVFGIGAKLQGYLMQVINLMSVPFRSRFSYLEGAGDWDALRSLFLRGTRLTALLTLTLTGVLFLETDSFIPAWMGPGFERSSAVLRILLPAIALELGQVTSVVALYGIGRHGPMAWATLVESLLKLGLSLVLVRSHGIEGVALGTALPMALNKIVFLPGFTCRSLRLGMGQWLREGVAGPVAAAAVGLLANLALGTVWHPQDLTMAVLRLAVGTLPFLVAGWFLVLQSEDRQVVRRLVGLPRRAGGRAG